MKRGIGNDEVVFFPEIVCQEIPLERFDPVVEWTVRYVFGGIGQGGGIGVYGIDGGFGKTLRHHQGDQPAACSYVQYGTGTFGIGPSARQYAVRSYLHG